MGDQTEATGSIVMSREEFRGLVRFLRGRQRERSAKEMAELVAADPVARVAAAGEYRRLRQQRRRFRRAWSRRRCGMRAPMRIGR